MAVPLHLLFAAFNDDEENDKEQQDINTTIERSENASSSDTELATEDETIQTQNTCTTIGRPAIEAAQSIVKACLQHVCK